MSEEIIPAIKTESGATVAAETFTQNQAAVADAAKPVKEKLTFKQNVKKLWNTTKVKSKEYYAKAKEWSQNYLAVTWVKLKKDNKWLALSVASAGLGLSLIALAIIIQLASGLRSYVFVITLLVVSIFALMPGAAGCGYYIWLSKQPLFPEPKPNKLKPMRDDEKLIIDRPTDAGEETLPAEPKKENEFVVAMKKAMGKLKLAIKKFADSLKKSAPKKVEGKDLTASETTPPETIALRPTEIIEPAKEPIILDEFGAVVTPKGEKLAEEITDEALAAAKTPVKKPKAPVVAVVVEKTKSFFKKIGAGIGKIFKKKDKPQKLLTNTEVLLLNAPEGAMPKAKKAKAGVTPAPKTATPSKEPEPTPVQETAPEPKPEPAPVKPKTTATKQSAPKTTTKTTKTTAEKKPTATSPKKPVQSSKPKSTTAKKPTVSKTKQDDAIKQITEIIKGQTEKEIADIADKGEKKNKPQLEEIVKKIIKETVKDKAIKKEPAKKPTPKKDTAPKKTEPKKPTK
jgi:hypothetical protein